MADLVTLDQLKTALGVTDNSCDAQLANAITTATSLVLDWLNRDPRALDYVERTDGRGSDLLLVDQYPINSVASIVIAGEPVSADRIDFDANTIFLNPACGFPRGRRNVTVSYNAGHDPLPAAVTLGVIYTVRAVLSANKVDLNSSGESWAGVSSQQWNPGGPGTVPVAAQTVLRQYQRKLSLP